MTKRLDISNKWFLGVILLLFAHIFILINVQFTAWPEMLLWPYLILKGWLPYQNIAIVHTPLLPVELSAIFQVIGIGVWQLKIITWTTILIIDLIVLFVAKRIWNIKVALVSLFFYIILQVSYAGNGLWFDLCLAFWGLAIYYSLWTKKYFLVGVFWVLAFLTKQTAIWFLIPVRPQSKFLN